METPVNVTLVTNLDQLEEVRKFLEINKIFGLDIETNYSKYFPTRKIRTIQIGTQEKQYVIDLLHWHISTSISPEQVLPDHQGYYGKNIYPTMKPVMDVLCPVFESKDYLKVGSHLNFEYENLFWNLGIRLWNVYSTDLAERVLWAGTGGQASFKNYPFYSLAETVKRHFEVELSKDLQDSFDLETELKPEQLDYCALDIIWPLKLRDIQKPLLIKHKLAKTAKIEFDCIMPFVEMHLNGQRIDKEKWNGIINDARGKLADSIAELDNYFVKWVGNKNDFHITDETIAADTLEWKGYNKVTSEELELKKLIKKDPKFKAELSVFEAQRKEKKEQLKKETAIRKKSLTAYRKLLPDCEGNALINYGSPAQILEVLQTHGFKSLEDTNDKTLKKFGHKPIIACIQSYREYDKLIKAYGDQWTKEWVTHPCKEEGWLWMIDGKLHPIFNQLDAETGRSTSERPNGQNLPRMEELRACFIVDPPDEEEPEGYVQVTADMSGAELRIIAELSEDPVWINAFNRGEDVHSVCTEILYPKEWKEGALEDCKYFKNNAHLKCKCPVHKKLREETKAINFKIAYGGVAQTLADDLLITVEEAQAKLDKHKQMFPKVWDYLDKSGKSAYALHEARDMFGRRRIFNEPTIELASKYVHDDLGIEFGENPKLEEKDVNKWKRKFYERKGRGPDSTDEFFNFVLNSLIMNKKIALVNAQQREGKNHCIQATNASIAKLAIGCGFDPKGKPYLWHILPQFKAKVIRFVHDELGVICPKRYGEVVAQAIGDAFKRAAAEVMKHVVMEFEYKISYCWSK